MTTRLEAVAWLRNMTIVRAKGVLTNYITISLMAWNECPSLNGRSSPARWRKQRSTDDARNPGALCRLIAGGAELRALSQPVREATQGL
jgi:hypothetical protein